MAKRTTSKASKSVRYTKPEPRWATQRAPGQTGRGTWQRGPSKAGFWRRPARHKSI